MPAESLSVFRIAKQCQVYLVSGERVYAGYCGLERASAGGNKNGSSGNNRAKRGASARRFPSDSQEFWVRIRGF